MSTNAMILAISIVVPLVCAMVPLFIAIHNWRNAEQKEHEDTRTRLTKLEEGNKHLESMVARIERTSNRIENKVN